MKTTALLQVFLLIFSTAAAVKDLKVLAHWSLNGSETGITLHGGPTFVEGRLPGTKAIAFTKLSSYARIPSVSLQYRSFTIALWIKVYSILSRPQHFFSDWYSPWNFYFGLLRSSTLIFSRHTGQNGWPSIKTNSNYTFDIQKWKHVAVVWDNTTLKFKFYIDAKEVNIGTFLAGKELQSMPAGTTWSPERPTFELGDNGHRDEHQFLGELQDLYIIDGVTNREQILFISGIKESGNADISGCIQGTSSRRVYSDVIQDHVIVGPLLKSITALTDNDCKDACFMHVPDVCYMFNYHPQTKKCELFYKDRASEYRVEMRNGYLYKTQKCKSNPCLNGGQCYSLGEQSHTACLCKPGYTGPTCT